MSDAPSASSASAADAAPPAAQGVGVGEGSAPAITPAATAVAGLPGAAADFDAIYREHSRAIFYLALRMLGDPQRAEDATHDVFLKAYRARAGFRGAAAVRTWLYRIALNHCQNLRASWHQRHIVASDDPATLDPSPTSSQPDTPLRAVESRELGGRIQQALDQLPPEHRLLLLLVADKHLGYDEAAALTGQSRDAVRGKLHRARKAFATAFARTA